MKTTNIFKGGWFYEKKNDYTFAGLLILIGGVLFLLLNLKIINFEWLMFILSIGLIVGYFIKGHMGYLVSGLVLLGISLVSLLNQYAFPGVNIKGFYSYGYLA